MTFFTYMLHRYSFTNRKIYSKRFAFGIKMHFRDESLLIRIYRTAGLEKSQQDINSSFNLHTYPYFT